MVSIYALTNPDGEIRYIGKANEPVTRLKSHMRDARMMRTTPVHCWIRSLVAKGEAPRMVVIEVVDGPDWQSAERRQIAAHAGPRLLNLAEGGNEPFCPPEVRAENGRKAAKARNPLIWKARHMLGQTLSHARRDGYACLAKLEKAVALFDSATPEIKLRMAQAVCK